MSRGPFGRDAQVNAAAANHGRSVSLFAELVLRDAQEEQRWFGEQQPTVVVLAAAKGGGITANSPYPTDFLLDNLKIQAAVIETAWRSGVLHVDDLGEACMFAL